MKEVLVIAWQFTNTGGDWTYCLNITKEYLEMGFAVTVLAGGNKWENIGQQETLLTKSLLKSDNPGLLSKAKLAFDFIKQNQLSKVQKDKLFSTDWFFVHVHSMMGGVGFRALRSLKESVPVLYTLHDYHLLCPTSNAYVNDKNCFECVSHGHISVLKNNCRDSLVESSVLYAARVFSAIPWLKERVNFFLCPSKFLFSQMLTAGFPKEKLVNNGYCLTAQKLEDEQLSELPQTNGIFYAGRLERYKGIQVLVEACIDLGVELTIAGSGSLSSEIAEIASSEGNVKYLGHIGKSELNNYLQRARLVCVPSLWNENYPFAVTEALLLGKTVVGSDKGGIPELVLDGRNGFVYEADNVGSLKSALRKGLNREPAWSPREIKRDIIERFDASRHLSGILNLVESCHKQ